MDNKSKVPLKTINRSKLASSREGNSTEASKSLEEVDWYELSWVHDWLLHLFSQCGTTERVDYQQGGYQVCALE